MDVQQDFQDLLELLNKFSVKYMIIGGYALAYHGAPRYTGDIDIFVKPDSENAEKIINTLDEFVKNKRATGRKKDMSDLEALGFE